MLHYFEICSILANTTVNAYYALCQKLGEAPTVDGVDVIAETNKHYKILKEAELKKNTENFENIIRILRSIN